MELPTHDFSRTKFEQLANKTIDFILMELPKEERTVAHMRVILGEIQNAIYHRRLELL